MRGEIDDHAHRRADQHVVTIADPEYRDVEDDVAKRAPTYPRYECQEHETDDIELLTRGRKSASGRENGHTGIVEQEEQVHADC
jgi:hypothetical protein